jgi:protein tyrosine/serine phosphatase
MHDRIVPFERVLNFRDFGGYDTPNGKLKRNMLWRSAAFYDASEADIARLNAMGVRFLVDLRRPDERVHEPNKWPGEACLSIQNDEGDANGLSPHLQALVQSDLTAESVAGYMRKAYLNFPFDPRHIMLYRAWFKELGEGGPGVIHCAAGKDRTGIGCALTLHALGVDEETIFADYEFTNQASNIEARLPRIRANMERRVGNKLDDDVLRPMLGVKPEYLRSALDVMQAKHGSVDGYLEQVLGVGARERETLRSHLLV